nr:chloroplastic group IIB intron splicing facilitator CRS2-B, chloroplastic [Ipomoea batatas]
MPLTGVTARRYIPESRPFETIAVPKLQKAAISTLPGSRRQQGSLQWDSPNPILHCSSYHSSVTGREIRGFRDDRLPCPSSPSTFMSMVYSLSPAKSCTGLGNPGNKYHGTRHNVGFEMIDQISQEEGILLNTIQSKALIGIGSIGEVPVVLAKPQTYMNFSGESVGQLAAYYQVPLRHILLVHDEMSLPNGVLRLKPKRGHGHHNGVKSVMEHLDGCHQFPRLCIGIGNPPGEMDMKAFLLQKFSETNINYLYVGLSLGVKHKPVLVEI